MYTSLDMPLDDMIRSGSYRNWGRGKARVRGRGRGGISRGRPLEMSQRGLLRVNIRPSPYVIAKSFSRAKDLISRHDLFKESMASAGLLGLESGLKLYVSNLDNGVSNEDIKDLFSEVGNLKRCAVHYDRNGRPSGSAEVHFVRKSDAVAALTRYNNVQLDGKAMKIETVGTNLALPDVPRVNSIGGPYGRGNRMAMNSNIRASNFGQVGLGSSGRMPGGNRGGFQRLRGRGRGFGQGRGFGRGRGFGPGRGFGQGERGRGRGRNQPRVKSADELNKELETYHAMST